MTKTPSRSTPAIVSTWEAFRRATVWHPINTDPNDDDRSGPRFWYPTYDVLAILLGLAALFQGSPLLNRHFPWWFTNGMGIFLVVTGSLCLVGVIFPRLSLLELLGKMGIVFLLGAYAGTVAFLAEHPDNWFPVIALFMAVWLLGPRITKLVIMITRQLAHRRQKKRGTNGLH